MGRAATRMIAGWVATALAGAACTAVLNPERLDDVIRCGVNEDCPEPDNNRFANVCRYGDEFAESDPAEFDQVCVAEFAHVDCKAQASGPHSEFGLLWSQALARPTLYLGACEGTPGEQGCKPMKGGGGCVGELKPHPVTGLCDDQDPETFPAVGDLLIVEYLGLDVQDQFCKSYFCDSDFVCDHSGGNSRCVPCSGQAGLGVGGCFDVYRKGSRSSVYLSDAENSASCPEVAHRDKVKFGFLPEEIPGE